MKIKATLFIGFIAIILGYSLFPSLPQTTSPEIAKEKIEENAVALNKEKIQKAKSLPDKKVAQEKLDNTSSLHPLDLAEVDRMKEEGTPEDLQRLLKEDQFENPYVFASAMDAIVDLARNSNNPAIQQQAFKYFTDQTQRTIDELKYSPEMKVKRAANGNLVILLECMRDLAYPESLDFLGEFLSIDLDNLIFKSTAVQALARLNHVDALPYLDQYIESLEKLDQKNIDVIEAKRIATETRRTIELFSKRDRN